MPVVVCCPCCQSNFEFILSPYGAGDKKMSFTECCKAPVCRFCFGSFFVLFVN